MYRIEEIARQGSRWITGSSNHDSLRKGANQNPYSMPINTYFGKNLKDIISHGFHSPATKMLEYFMPGIPMDFAQAVTRSPWLFMRNTDWQWGVKVMSEEAFFLDWYVTEKEYKNCFKALQSVGFQSLEQIKSFLLDLRQIILLTDYDWKKMVKMFQSLRRNYTAPKDDIALRNIAKAFFSDAHDFCNVTKHQNNISDREADFFLSLRQFRNENTWLQQNFSERDFIKKDITHLHSTVYRAERTAHDGRKLIFIGNMEGKAVRIFSKEQPFLCTPNVVQNDDEFILENGAGILLLFS
jgi:hypothetical protein